MLCIFAAQVAVKLGQVKFGGKKVGLVILAPQFKGCEVKQALFLGPKALNSYSFEAP